MLYRLAAYDDIDSILNMRMELLREVTGDYPQGLDENIRSYLEKSIRNGNCLCGLTELDGRIIATAMLCCFQSIPDECNVSGNNALLASVYTHPQFRGNQYMKNLLVFLIGEAKKNNIGCIYAAAERSAMPLYERVGFHKADTLMYMDL